MHYVAQLICAFVFALCKKQVSQLFYRLVGAAHNADLEGMGFAEQDCLGAGVRLLQAADRIHDIDKLMVIALMLA